MTRKKVKLAWILNDSSRRASLKKRRLGLMKKVKELAILCDVDACLVMYSPNDVIPAVWPSHSVVHQQLARFQSLSDLEKMKKMTKQDSYLEERLNKVEEQQTKQLAKNKEVEMNDLIRQIEENDECLGEFNLKELQGLTWFMMEKMMGIRKRMEYLEQLPLAPTLPNQNVHPFETAQVQGDHGKTPTDPYMLNQFFIDMMNKNMHESMSNNTSMMSDMGLPNHPYIGTDTNYHQQGLLRHPFGTDNPSAVADIGIPIDVGVGSSHWNWNFRGGHQTDMGLLPPFGFKTIPFGTDIGLGSNHSFAGETMPPSSGLFGGDSGAADDGKTLPSNFPN